MNDANFAIVHAFGCCFLRVDFSRWPLFVPAGKTHSSESAAARRISITAAARSVSGIVPARSLLFKRYVRRAVADVLPSESKTLFWPQSAVDQHDCDIAQQKRILGLDGCFASLH